MTAFAIRDGGCGSGAACYEAGLVTLPDGTARGVETIARLTPREDGASRSDLLGALRGALAGTARLPMPVRMAASTLRAGLGIIEEGMGAQDDGVAVEIAFEDGSAILARMPLGLVAVIRRDREVALGALARAAAAPVEEPLVNDSPEAERSAPALTSIFRYEKRNGRLRRVADPGGPKG